MSEYAKRAIAAAQRDVGRNESPWGSNDGSEIRRFLDPWGSWMRGNPWCGTAVAYWWEAAGMDGMRFASPSTGAMCAIARAHDLTCSPRPGACFCICGTHTGMLIYNMGGGVWKTIDGNSGDQVAWRQRSMHGALVYAPPEISKGIEAPEFKLETWFYLEDVAMKGVREWGGFSSKEARNKAMRRKRRELGRGVELRAFKRPYPSRKSPYFFERTDKPKRFYGGWDEQEARAEARQHLQRQLDRRLRPFSVKRRVEGKGQAERIGKTT